MISDGSLGPIPRARRWSINAGAQSVMAHGPFVGFRGVLGFAAVDDLALGLGQSQGVRRKRNIVSCKALAAKGKIFPGVLRFVKEATPLRRVKGP